MTGSRDRGVVKAKPVAAPLRDRLICKSSLMQRSKEPVTATIAGENASGAISTVCCGCQADDKQLSAGVSKIWNW
jgi:hypothetical protein